MLKAMPRGVIVLLIVNSLLSLLFAGNLVVFYAEGVTRTLTFVASWTALAGLLATIFGLLLRGALWHRISRTALYVVALVFGIQIMGTIPRILEPEFALSALGLAIAVFYLVGARGYLNSETAHRYLGLEAPPAEAKLDAADSEESQ